MVYSESLASRIRQVLKDHRGITEKKMFGGIGFLLHGNMCVGVSQTSLIVRLGPEQADAARKQPNVVEFDVAGRPLKAAVDHLTRNMAFDLGPDIIRVNAIAPGAIRTAALATVLTPDVEAAMLKHTPLGRLGEGSDIAAAAVYLASPAASWVSGQVLTVSGGGVQELD